MGKSGSHECLEADVQIGDFRIEERLGAGGMGIVYRARQISLNRIVALKVLGNALTRSSDVVRFQREAQAAARLNHPNIATVHFVGQDDQVCYMAIEYIDGPSLGRIIRCLATAGDPKLNLDSVVQTIEQAEPRAPTIRFDRATATLGSEDAAACQEYDLDKITAEAEQLAQTTTHIRRCCELVRDAAKALSHAHGKSVVHRDIKPENLLLDKDGQVHIIDFGIARFFEDATVTQTGALVGTPMYMSPEQVTARLDVDHRTDIYSLGLVLYELLTLGPAMLAPTREGILRNIATKALAPVSSKNPAVSQDLEGVVHKATARDPDERYQTADEFAGDMQDWLNGKPVAAKPYRHKMDLSEIEATRPRSVLAMSVGVQSLAVLVSAYGLWPVGPSDSSAVLLETDAPRDSKEPSFMPKINKSLDQWRAQLTPEQFEVTRRAATERAFTGQYWNHKEDGTYHCVCCGTPLFTSETKYDSGCGWPSFFRPSTPENLHTLEDRKYGTLRTEVLCSNCGAHLGHV
ncbi:MAG: peptide-methionine (R)-S-oxide reductase MsrB, partial [Planctomycetes bacterium]|nr:peptide-methionine (R)-S-oxide reductase MsrB [Planctomycetota bacterium]